MKKQLRWFGHAVIYLALIAIGLLIGKIITVPGITCSKELNPLEGVSILFSLFALIYVALILDKHKEVKKNQRELIFKRIDDLDRCVDSTRLVDNRINFKEAVSCLKKINRLSMYVGRFIVLVNISEDEFTKSFQKMHKDLNVLMTFTPAKLKRGQNHPIKCEKGMLIYSDERVYEIESAIEFIKSYLYDLLLKVAKE